MTNTTTLKVTAGIDDLIRHFTSIHPLVQSRRQSYGHHTSVQLTKTRDFSHFTLRYAHEKCINI